MKPIPIDETEELERIQSLRQRENLIKGMGINDFVHRILFGTPGNVKKNQIFNINHALILLKGTVATIPPPLTSSNNQSNNTNNNQQHHHSLPGNIPGYQNLNSAQLNQYFQQQQQQSQDILHTKYISSSSIYNNTNIINNSSSSKLEIKARNYNPFENHSFINEVSLLL
jgi:hypothetical protein